jgi:hypothetical protein
MSTKKKANIKRPGSLEQRATSAASDLHNTHPSSPSALKLSLHEFKMGQPTKKVECKKQNIKIQKSNKSSVNNIYKTSDHVMANTEDEFLVFSSRNSNPSKKALVSLCLKPNSVVTFHGQTSIKKLDFPKKSYNSTSKVGYSSKAFNNSDTGIINSKTDKVPPKDNTHITNSLVYIKEQVKGILFAYSKKEEKMSEQISTMERDLVELKARLCKYEKL